ncbi:MAG: hypothetical protein EOP40_11610 [Rubrivivax sp.]|nr:MAG: hypothetical protein EOP40_11610 [Rubrivivax sp.]
MPNLPLAQDLIRQAADLCALASQHAERYVRFEQQRAQRVLPAVQALDAAHPALQDPIKDIQSTLAAAEQAVRAQNHDLAASLLAKAQAQAEQATALQAASQTYVKRIKALETQATALTSHRPRAQDAVIGPDVRGVDLALQAARDQALANDYTAALKALDTAELTCKAAELKRSVKAKALSADQMKQACTALMATEGGAGVLDKLVGSLTEADSHDAVLAAMAARFGLEAAVSEGSGASAASMKELCRLYQVMTRVPDTHTKDNPSLKKVTRKATPGSAYGSGEITMGEGHPDASASYRVGATTELPAVDPDCQPKAGSPTPTYFDWNTLHEIGHAMDDKKQFMATHGSGAAYGGWITHGGDLLAVGAAAAAAFGFADVTPKIIAVYLDNGTEPAATVTDPAHWAAVKRWVAKVRHSQNPWSLGAECNKSVTAGGFKIGDRVFHEAYDKVWVSYLASARAQGMTGYQFRAPGEWFSELYAGYKMQKLKDSHPAKAWLDKLFATSTP